MRLVYFERYSTSFSSTPLGGGAALVDGMGGGA